MKILVIIADCLTRNSSANLCHLAYIKGLVNLGYEVTLLSADGRNYETDSSMKIPNEVKCYYYNAVSLYEKLSLKKKHINSKKTLQFKNEDINVNLKTKTIRKIKDTILSFYGVHGVYSTFVKVAKEYQSNENYDYAISISTPPASHLLTYKLISKGNIKCKKWIQIWEDPWYTDVYGFHNKNKVFKEEKKILSYAEQICYVSPLTLKNQQKLFPESANKMYWQPLPFYYNDTNECVIFESNEYGYFGDYVPEARNLKPFYETARELNIKTNICGNPNNLFENTDKITINPRLPLSELKPIEDRTNVLVFLCNKKGGQIPGKIYQYSATKKTILFILDGTSEEKEVLKKYFGSFNRYVFCENNVDDIKRAITLIETNQMDNIKNVPLENFNPSIIIEQILNYEV